MDKHKRTIHMNKCSTCQTELTEENAYRKNTRRLQSMCKKCFNEYTSQRWIRRKKEAIEFKGGKCQSCGYDKYYGALEFHHRDPTKKEFSWNKMRLVSAKKLQAELDKCDLLCANCHREVHATNSPW